MKHGIELNGVSNLHLLLDEIVSTHSSPEEKDQAVRNIKIQLDRLERYMIAYSDFTNNGDAPPFWHEVLSNPTRYPTNRERIE